MLGTIGLPESWTDRGLPAVHSRLTIEVLADLARVIAAVAER